MLKGKSKLYIFYSGASFISILIGEIISSVLYEVLEIGGWAIAITISITVCLKVITSLRFFPLFTGLRISETHVWKMVLGYEANRLSLEHTYLYLKRFHGVNYAIFSPMPITDMHWINISKNRGIIIYPICAGMREDFHDLFKKAVSL